MNTKEAISKCIKNPENLYDLQPHLFESVVAELLANFGWRVNVTPPTRDGGYDILGITTDPSGLQTSWIVECKRYSAERKVGVEIACQAIDVRNHIGVPNSVLVTTSSFTSGVMEIASARQDLHLVSYQTLVKWLKEYREPINQLYTQEQSFSSCFISYSSKDAEFTQKIASYLKDQGIPVWYAPDDIQPGLKIVDQIKKAITSFDRLIVVLSADSIKSNWVHTELSMALKRESAEGEPVLFPISLISMDDLRKWECIDTDSGIDLARELRAYHIPDFSNWVDKSIFEKQAAKVVEALKDTPDSDSGEKVFDLIQRVRDGYPGNRAKAARELGELGKIAEAAVPALRKALKDSSGQVRNASAWALAAIGNAEANAALKEYEERTQ